MRPAGVLFRDDTGRLLLVKPVYKEGWDLWWPGAAWILATSFWSSRRLRSSPGSVTAGHRRAHLVEWLPLARGSEGSRSARTSLAAADYELGRRATNSLSIPARIGDGLNPLTMR